MIKEGGKGFIKKQNLRTCKNAKWTVDLLDFASFKEQEISKISVEPCKHNQSQRKNTENFCGLIEQM
jgi:hypothetical protein